MSIEVEKRAVLTEDQYEQLFHELRTAGATDLGENDTKNIFFLGETSQVKVTANLSKQTAKIVWKSQKMGATASAEELELAINPADAHGFDTLLQQIMPEAARYETLQQRHDFELDDTTISLKYSADWGYHLEIDKNVESKAAIPEALRVIEAVATRLNVRLLTEAEESALVERLIAARQH